MNSGIYKIINIQNGKLYIGSANNLKRRKIEHFYYLKYNKHINKILQNSVNKYGINNFRFEILVQCPKEYCIKLEQWFMDNLKPYYNICKIAGNRLGVKHKEESKAKLKNTIKTKKELIGTYKLSNDKINDIKQMIKDNFTFIVIAEKYKISKSTVSRIKNEFNIISNKDLKNRTKKTNNTKYLKKFIKDINIKYFDSKVSKYQFLKQNNLTQYFYKILNNGL